MKLIVMDLFLCKLRSITDDNNVSSFAINLYNRILFAIKNKDGKIKITKNIPEETLRVSFSRKAKLSEKIWEILIAAFYGHDLSRSGNFILITEKELVPDKTKSRVIDGIVNAQRLLSTTASIEVEIAKLVCPSDALHTARNFVKLYHSMKNVPEVLHPCSGVSAYACPWECHAEMIESKTKDLCDSGAPLLIYANVQTDTVEHFVRLTHSSELCIDAVRVLVFAIGLAKQGESRETIWSRSVNYARTSVIRKIVQLGRLYATPCVVADHTYNIDCPDPNFVGISLQLAFYEMLYSESFDHGVRRTIARGGNSLLNAGVVGAMLSELYPSWDN